MLKFFTQPVSSADFKVGHLVLIVALIGIALWLFNTFAVKQNVIKYGDGTTALKPSFGRMTAKEVADHVTAADKAAADKAAAEAKDKEAGK